MSLSYFLYSYSTKKNKKEKIKLIFFLKKKNKKINNVYSRRTNFRGIPIRLNGMTTVLILLRTEAKQ